MGRTRGPRGRRRGVPLFASLGALVLCPLACGRAEAARLRATRSEGGTGAANTTGAVAAVPVPGLPLKQGLASQCVKLGQQCGGMGFSGVPDSDAESLCCSGLTCLEQDVFFSGCLAKAEAEATLSARAALSSADQTAIGAKPPVPGEAHNYAQVLYLSILFYEAQRSGALPAGNRIPWRKASALNDTGLRGENLTGGWYDSGGFIKFGLPMAWSTTVLTWGLLEFWDAYEASGEVQNMLDSIRWPLDYLIRAHTAPAELYVQVGDQSDYAYWGPPEAMPAKRAVYRVTCDNPGSEPVAETAAAMAAGYLVFKDIEPPYAETLLEHARQLLEFGRRCPGNYVREGRLFVAEPYYTSYTGYMDELAWASLWLFKATGDPAYLEAAKKDYALCCSGPLYTAFTWDNKAPAVQLMMYRITGDPQYSQDVSAFVNSWAGRQTTPEGLAFYAGSPNKYASSASLIALLAADAGLNPDSYRRFAKAQIHYMLGGQAGPGEHMSFLVGYGARFAQAPHHRASSCPSQATNATCRCSTEPNYYTLYGALVGGPEPDDSFEDNCADFQANEVCTHCNAAFQSAVAGLKHLALRNLLP